jgi:hypothetical protein
MVDYTLTEIKETKGIKGTGKIRFSLSNLLSLFGQASAESGIERETGQEIKKILSKEQKFRFIVEALASKELVLENFEQAAEATTKKGMPAYIVTEAQLFAPQFLDPDEGCNNVNRDGSLHFTNRLDIEYDESDDWFKKNILITMRAGVKKLADSNDGILGATSHIAIQLRRNPKNGIRLGLFGYLTPVSNKEFQIKPFAMWQ